jgi:hypothetical protein
MILIAFLFVIHGFAHLPGFVVAWRITKMEEMPYKTTLLAGKLDIGDTGIRIMGIFWLLGALSFLILGVSVLLQKDWWAIAALPVAGVSTILCILGWPESRIILILNVLILIALILARSLNWI